MATRNIVPRATGEGSIGTPEKKWNSANIKNINAESIDIDNIDVTNLDVENLDVENLDVENLHSESVSPVNTLQRETAYVVDDIVYSSKLNAKYYLLCITAGTTASVEPSFSGAESNTQITDGTVVWRVQTITSQEKAAGVPIGCVQAYAGQTTPQGWLLCDGSAVSRATYANLFSVIGTTYGAGNGSTTFNLPNLTDKFVQGSSTAGTVKNAGLPNITGEFRVNNQGSNYITYVDSTYGAFSTSSMEGTDTITSSTPQESRDHIVVFSASNSNSIYGNSTTVQPPALTMRYIIKY